MSAASRGPVTAERGCEQSATHVRQGAGVADGRAIAGTCVTEIGGNVTHSLHHMDGQTVVTACWARFHFLDVVYEHIEPTCALCGEEMEAS